MIGIINIGMGNLTSVYNALNYLQIPNRIISNPSDIYKCHRIILPGVGAYGEAMRILVKLGFNMELQEFALNRQQPVLGICLGMQLLLQSSTEHGFNAGLNFIDGQVHYLGDNAINLPIPHIGWNEVFTTKDSLLFNGINEAERTFYFVHSYYCRIDDHSLIKGQAHYGFDFDAMFEAENIFGVQFHPEKSQQSGLKLLQNFSLF